MVLPSGLKATHRTHWRSPRKEPVSLPVATLHSLTLPSTLPETRALPSGLKATDVTQFTCPSRVAISLPLATSHSLIVLSLLPEASVLPSGLKATARTSSVCPLKVARSLGAWAERGEDTTSPRPATPNHTAPSLRLTFGFIARLRSAWSALVVRPVFYRHRRVERPTGRYGEPRRRSRGQRLRRPRR